MKQMLKTKIKHHVIRLCRGTRPRGPDRRPGEREGRGVIYQILSLKQLSPRGLVRYIYIYIYICP